MAQKGRRWWEDFQTHQDAGARDHLARRQEREHVVRFLESKGAFDLAKNIKSNCHYSSEDLPEAGGSEGGG